jgi:FAD/FMN-containing dehydrogenase
MRESMGSEGRTGGTPAGPLPFEARAAGEPSLTRRQMLGGCAAAVGAMLTATAFSTPPSRRRITNRSLAHLERALRGRLILPCDPDYHARRLTWNRRLESHPLAIVEVADERDVASAIAWAQLEGVPLVPRSGGHSYVGASGGNGLVLDLRRLDTIEFDRTSGLVVVGTGSTLGSIYRALHCEHGLSIPSGTCPGVGIGGITQGGGWGWASREFGLTCDRLVGARVVLANGSILDTDSPGGSDLLWALRGGGGGAFGIATEFRFEPIPSVARSIASVRYRWADFEAGLLAWQENLLSALPWWITPVASLSTDPNGDEPIFRVSLSIPGPPEFARILVEQWVPPGVDPLSVSANVQEPPSCWSSIGSGASFGKQKSAMPREPIAPPALAIARRWFEERRRDDAIPSQERASLVLDGYGGRIASVATETTAFAHRSAIASLQFITSWQSTTPPETVTAHLDWIRGFHSEIRPWLGRGCYVNYADEDLEDWPWAYWDSNLPRLQQLKREFDPEGFFSGLHTVPLA